MPLDATGQKEAGIAAENLRRFLPQAPDSFEASPLYRAQQTANIISQKLNIFSKPQPALADWNTGKLAGELVKDVLPRLQDLVIHIHEPAPGGEPLSAYLGRFVPHIKAKVSAPGVHLVVGHARGSSIIEGLASPVAGVGADIDHEFLLAKPKLKPGGVMIIPANWNVKIHNPTDGETDAT